MDGEETPAVTAREHQRFALGCVGVLAALVLGPVLLFAGFVLWGTVSGPGEDSPAERQQAAESACEQWVRDQLKAPDTADFQGAEVTGTGPWEVSGTVDATNTFGGTVRSSWSCTVRLDGDTLRGQATVTDP